MVGQKQKAKKDMSEGKQENQRDERQLEIKRAIASLCFRGKMVDKHSALAAKKNKR